MHSIQRLPRHPHTKNHLATASTIAGPIGKMGDRRDDILQHHLTQIFTAVEAAEGQHISDTVVEAFDHAVDARDPGTCDAIRDVERADTEAKWARLLTDTAPHALSRCRYLRIAPQGTGAADHAARSRHARMDDACVGARGVDAAVESLRADQVGTGQPGETRRFHLCHEACADIVARGGRVARAPIDFGNVARCGFAKDPDGNWIEIAVHNSLITPSPCGTMNHRARRRSSVRPVQRDRRQERIHLEPPPYRTARSS